MSKQQVFYIHGAASYSKYESFLQDLRTMPLRDLPGEAEPAKKWTKTFREDLGENFEVFMPRMPNSNNAKYEEWKIWFERHFEYLHDGLVLLGWSQGAYFLAKYLIENEPPAQIKALFLGAAPFAPDDFGGEDGGDFAFDTTRVSELAGKAGKITIMHSKDDFVVPFSHGERYAAALPEAEFVVYEDKNHFLIEEFSDLIQRIKKLA